MQRPALLAAIVALVGLTACSGNQKIDPILELAAQESLTKGKEYLAAEKYGRARPYLSHAFEVEPNSASGREALLLVADAFYLQGGRSNYEQAERKYRDFLNRFPTSDRAAYVQFQIANTLAQRMEKPDRDQKITRQALEAYSTLQRLYPTSEQASRSDEKIRLVRANLAEHEFSVGRFYLRYRAPRAAANRFETLLEEFPEFEAQDRVLHQLGLAYRDSKRVEKAREVFTRLEAEFPESAYLKDIPELPPTPPPTEEVENADTQDSEEAAKPAKEESP